jgi:CheY-like chemotaxis protein
MKRVLLVEDNPDVRSLLAEVLKAGGYDVEDVWSFGEAKERLREREFDLLVSNVLLPGGGTGAELAAIARAKGIKYLLVSGHPTELQTMAEREHPHIAKPFRPSDLVERINRMWDGE